jgi:hypothetical protein
MYSTGPEYSTEDENKNPKVARLDVLTALFSKGSYL